MKHKKILCLALAAVMAVSVGCLAACGGGPAAKVPVPKQDMVLPTWDDNAQHSTLVNDSNIKVHDPSIFQDPEDGTYYAFGTHFAVASSPDLLKWEQKASDGEWTKLYGTSHGTSSTGWWSVLSQAHAHAGGTMASTWAPDVNYYEGKYYMYVSVTAAFGSSRSAICRVEADSVMGPYSNEVLIVTSDGSGKSNAIDPELFYDKDGGLWMVYGSTYGGIFIKELYNSGENWGLPKEEGIGKNIWGNGNNVEGPFIFYSAETDYYYLMTSYGALMYSYNMRLARSKNPNGPYEDITGTDVATINGGGAGGNKVAGSFKFASQNGEGWAAIGHNSVIKDELGRYFVVAHARRQGTFKKDTEEDAGVTPAHRLMVYQLYFNEDSWPVMSPTPYVGESAGLISQDRAAGEFDVVIHSQGITARPVDSVKYTLASDGTITSGGNTVGSWTVTKNYFVTINIDHITEVDGEEVNVPYVYKGVIVPGWNIYAKDNVQDGVIAITAVANVGNQGGSLWAISIR